MSTKTERLIYYKKRLCADEAGLVVVTDKWHVVGESPCFAYSVDDFTIRQVRSYAESKGLSLLDAAKLLKKKTKRIHKESSRFAFPTERAAMLHLQLLKRKQLRHMERETAFIQAFLKVDLDTLMEDSKFFALPGTASLVSKYLVFN